MVACSTNEYALKVVDPVISPERASSPRAKLWTLLGLFCGLCLALFAVFLRMCLERA